ncbi:hypothetical protein [Aeoliella mucimassa]|uniref:Uncharacterized protein n=1 Tax=Aeoliella mucimassa TaxID=2527972 RepID=A0A518AMR7_9BACT|nr:hypothetical protein [Aeoliella mucimassa]QDU56018.1 hypothetical protein Pan181_22200 [Aeoliella mucimassa]
MNPYQSPESPAVARSLSMWRSFAIVVMSGVGFGLAGSLLGLMIALLAPDYYRMVFHISNNSGTSLLQLGMGLGLTQGVGCGIAVGVALVFANAWYRSRIARILGQGS